jgi:RecA/RadA recombinase
MSEEDIQEVKESLTKKPPTKKKPSKGVSTGSTLLNLACTGRTSYGFEKGGYYFLVGDSKSGKSWLSLSCMAEASINPEFKDYRFIFDNNEKGIRMDVRKFFGREVYKRMEPPRVIDDEPVHSTTAEEFYYHLDDAFDRGLPFIYVLDSMDGLSTEDDEAKFQERKKAARKNEEDDKPIKVSGSYGTSKARINSNCLRLLPGKLEKSGSILIVISQTRDNIGFGAQFNPKTRSGGKSLRFWANVEIWTSLKGQIKKPVGLAKAKKDRSMGVVCQAEIKKNRMSGREIKIDIPIYWSHGIDDIGGMIDWLVEEGHWKKGKGGIDASELKFKGHRENLVSHIESGNLERDLKLVVTQVWKDIEEQCSIKRKKRYD